MVGCQRGKLLRVYGVGQAARRRDAKRAQPAADIARDPVEREPAALDDAAGEVLVHLARQPGQSAVHHVAGGMVQHQRGDAAALALPRGPDALGVHAGLDDGKVDALRPKVGSRRAGLEHREPPAHDRPGGQTPDLNAVGICFPRRQAGQAAGDDQRPVPGGTAAACEVPGVPLDPAGGGQILGCEKAESHNVPVSGR